MPVASARSPAAIAALPSGLRHSLWLGHQLARSSMPAISSGHPALDAELPDGGWPLAGLTELMPLEPGSGELGLLAPALARIAGQGQELLWIAPPHVPYAPALAMSGLALEHFTWIDAATPKEAAWTAEQALRSGACGAVLWWCEWATPEMLRRLHLAALDHACPLWALRPWRAQEQNSAAPLRLTCSPAPERQVDVQLVKRRGPPMAAPLRLQLADPAPARVRRRAVLPATPPLQERPGNAVAGRSSASAAA